MTSSEIQLLALGGAFGSCLTVLAWMAVTFVSERRADRRRAGRAAEGGLPEKTPLPPGTASEPHPAELLEASVRDFELKLYDGLDRVEDAVRRDGLL